MKANKFNLKQLENKWKQGLRASVTVIGNEAKNFFVENFRKQGFDDKSVKHWQPRKTETDRKSRNKGARAILVKSGDLRRSIKRHPANLSNLSIMISSDLPYAKIHNEGLEGKAWGKVPFKMPERRFIGDSYNLNEQMKKTVIRVIDKYLK